MAVEGRFSRHPQSVWALVLVLALGCGDGEMAGTDFSRAGPWETTSVRFELVDGSRPTPPSGAFAGAPERRLPTVVTYPRGAAGPLPLLVASHNLGGGPESLAYLATHLASHGFVVAAPTFPLTSLSSSTGVGFELSDIPNQAGDVGFVIDRLLAAGPADLPGITAPLDPDAVGLFGVSGGALTTQLATFDRARRDRRVAAAAVIALPLVALRPYDPVDVMVPVVFVAGTRDLLAAPPDNARILFESAAPPRFLAEISGANHLGFIDPPGLFGDRSNPDLGLCDLLRKLPVDLPDLDCVDDGGDAFLASEQQHALTRLVVGTFFDAFLRSSARSRRALANLPSARDPAALHVQADDPR